MLDEQAACTSRLLHQGLHRGDFSSTIKTLEGFVKPVALHPDTVQTTQAELWTVCVAVPCLGCITGLLYLSHIRDSLSYMPANPLSIPHALAGDHEHMVYALPKGTNAEYRTWPVLSFNIARSLVDTVSTIRLD